MITTRRFHALLVVCIAIILVLLSGFGFWQLHAVASFDRTVLLAQLTNPWQTIVSGAVSGLLKQEDLLFEAAAGAGFNPAWLEAHEDPNSMYRQFFLLTADNEPLNPPAGPASDIGEVFNPSLQGDHINQALFTGNSADDPEPQPDSGPGNKRPPTAARPPNLAAAMTSHPSQQWLKVARIYERAALDGALLPRTAAGALLEAGRMYENAGQPLDARRVYTQLLQRAVAAVIYPQDIAWTSFYWDEAAKRLSVLTPPSAKPTRPLSRETDPAWNRALDRAGLREDLQAWIIPAMADMRPAITIRSVAIEPSGRSLVRYGAGREAGTILGYRVNLPFLAQTIQARLQDPNLFVEILLPSGAVIASAGRLSAGSARAISNLPLDGYLTGCVLRISTQAADIARIVRRHTLVMVSMLAVMLGLAAIGLITLWLGISRQMELARLKSDFVANVSHELKTPLALIRLIGETLLLGRVGDAERRTRYYKAITRECQRLTTMINNVLNFSRIDQGGHAAPRQPQDPRKIAEPIFETYKLHLEKNGFTFRFDLPPDLPPVKLDAEGYAMVLVNLIDNAEKFSTVTRDIEVRLAVRDGAFVTEVADRGPGIPAKESEKIFERFYRARDAVQRQIRGTGIGLNLARHVARDHGGTLKVRPRAGGGSVFSLVIPI